MCVANANSDTISVISTRPDQVVETIPVRWQAQDLFGASPNALAMDAHGHTLYVCNGTQNAVGVISFHPGKSRFLGLFPTGKAGNSKLRGLIPTGWFPGRSFLTARAEAHGGQYQGTLPDRDLCPNSARLQFAPASWHAFVHPLPDRNALKRQTQTVLRNYRRAVAENVFLPARPASRPARARAHWRALGIQTRHLSDQGKPHLRSGFGRCQRLATGIRGCAPLASA